MALSQDHPIPEAVFAVGRRDASSPRQCHGVDIHRLVGSVRSSFVLCFAMMWLGPACENSASIIDPELSVLSFGGVEQVLALEPGRPGDPNGRWFTLRSRLVNRGDEPATLRVRTCYLRAGIDVRSTPLADFVGVALPACIEEPDVTTLAPGESSKEIAFSGSIRKSGRYTVSVRHAVDPELWGTIEIVVR